MIVVLGVPFLLGLFILSLLLQKQAGQFFFWEKIALAFAVGLGLLTALMYALTAINIPLNLQIILLAVGAIIGLIALYLFYLRIFCLNLNEIRSAFDFKKLKLNWLEGVLLGLIGFKVIYTFFIALIKPMIDVDAFQFYSIVAKGIFFTGKFFDPYFFQFISDKPPFPFLAQGWAFIGLGTVNDAQFKALWPALFLCFIIIFYSIMRRSAPRWFSLLFTFGLSSLPLMLYHVGTAYSDFPVTFYYSAGTFYLFLFMKEFEKAANSRGYLWLAAILLAVSLWVKKAALVLTGIDLIILLIFLFRRRARLSLSVSKPLLYGLVLFFLLSLPIIVQSRLQLVFGTIQSLGAAPPEFVQASEKSLGLGEKTAIIATTFLRKIFLYGDWQLLGALLIVSLVFFPKTAFSPPARYLLIILLIDFLSVFVQFESGGSFHWLLDGTLLDRLVMNEMPLALFFCAELIGSLFLPARTNR